MQTRIHPDLREHPRIVEVEDILRSCVHCGFCNATCPTYQELGDERDGPRGRIYLIKQMLETGTASDKTRVHLDRCLSCRSCETTCPSGVQYGRLVDVGRRIVEQSAKRPARYQFLAWTLRKILPFRRRFAFLLRVGQILRFVLPPFLKEQVPQLQAVKSRPTSEHDRLMLALAGCVQAGATPNTNAASTRVLDKLGIQLLEVPEAGCCGALSYHLSAQDEGLNFIKANIDAWWPFVEAGAEALVVTASGCGAFIAEYGDLLKHDVKYASKAAQISALCRDISEVLLAEDLGLLDRASTEVRTAFHCPCTLQHALKLGGSVERILDKMGIPLTTTRDGHLCCGSAGTYSIMQPDLSQKFLQKKLEGLMVEDPDQIVTANIGCQLHLASKAKVPVKHWIELLDQ